MTAWRKAAKIAVNSCLAMFFALIVLGWLGIPLFGGSVPEVYAQTQTFAINLILKLQGSDDRIYVTIDPKTWKRSVELVVPTQTGPGQFTKSRSRMSADGTIRFDTGSSHHITAGENATLPEEYPKDFPFMHPTSERYFSWHDDSKEFGFTAVTTEAPRSVAEWHKAEAARLGWRERSHAGKDTDAQTVCFEKDGRQLTLITYAKTGATTVVELSLKPLQQQEKRNPEPDANIPGKARL